PADPNDMLSHQAAVWKAIEDRIDQTDKTALKGGPIHKFVAAHIYETAKVEREKINAYASRAVKNIKAAGGLDVQDNLDAAWGVRHNRLMDLAESITNSMDSLDKMDWSKAESALQADPQLFMGFSQVVDKAVSDSRSIAHLAAKISRATKPNVTPEELAGLPQWASDSISNIIKNYSTTPDVLSEKLSEFKNSTFRYAGMQGRDLLAAARRQLDPSIAASQLGQEAITEAYAPAESMLTKAYGDLTRAGSSVNPEWMQRVGERAAETLRDYAPYSDRALSSIHRARSKVLRIADPIIQLAPVDEQNSAKSSMSELVRIVAARAPSPAAAKDALYQIKKAAGGFEDIDILDDEKLPFALKHSVSKQLAGEEGVKNLPVAYTTAVQAWKELSLASISYNVANLASGLFFGQKAGVDPADTLKALSRQLRAAGPAFRSALLRGELPAEMPLDGGLMPLLKRLGRVNAAGEIVRHPSMARSIGTGGETVAGKVLHQPALQRLALPVGVTFGVGTTAAGIMGGQEQPQAIGTGLAVGAGAGLGLGRIAAINRVMSGVIESALRDTAYYTAVEASHPQSASSMAVAIRAFNPGMLRRDMSGKIVDTVADKEGLAKWFERMTGQVSPSQLHDQAVLHGFRPEDANALAGQWSGGIEGLERLGVDVSNSFNFDYEDVPNITHWLRTSGVMPFVTWQTKALPVMAGILLSNPRYYILIDEYKRATDRDIAEAGLTPRFNDKMRLDLGDYVAE
ncbi:MAG TPA: hypothetical protein VIU41_15285, partial [Geobacteraceae bacterium]